ncbi:CFA53 protein, partial [Semnornis frantzii]|nr:CFA53 protein [Semnornis frantzii]
EEEQQLLKLENEELQRKKWQRQKECREMLLSAAEDRANRLNEEKQGELALEMKLLEKSLQESQKDTEKIKRKQELLKEQKTYLAHLAQQLEEEKQRQREVDKLFNEEKAKVWAKKAEQLQLEKEARKKLLKDVLNTRQEQIKEKLQRNAKEQEEIAQERKLLLAEAVAELEHLKEEKYARKLKATKEYQEHLRAQIASRQQARDAEEKERQRDYELGLAAERAYQEKLQDVLSRPDEKPAKTHPLRRKLMSSSPEHHL